MQTDVLCWIVALVDTIIDMDPSALEAFSLDYKVEWPTALVINRLVIDRYQMLFRHLFYCRHVERHLSTYVSSCPGWILH